MNTIEPNQPPSFQKPKTSVLAVISLVTALTCIAPAAIICGHLALSNINAAAGNLKGRGVALAGTILGYVCLLSYVLLLPTLFIGARAWKKGSDRAACIITQRNIQQAVRGYQSSNNLTPGSPLDMNAVQSYLGTVTLSTACPCGGTYEFSKTIPPTGVLVAPCPHAVDLDHKPKDHETW